MHEQDAFAQLAAMVRRLRGPGGCPWDRAQTHLSLRRYVLEEAREVAQAIGTGAPDELRDELGDLLLQILLHAAIAEEAGAFTLGGVLAGLAAKLLRRHPHVFGQVPPAASPEEAASHWEAVKADEERFAGGGGAGQSLPPGPARPGLLAGVSRTQPALSEARELGEHAAKVGFDWPRVEDVWAKVTEERDEFGEAWRSWLREPNPRSGTGGEQRPAAETAERAPLRRHAEEEFGDLLFACVQVGRLLGMDAEVALLAANEKFRRRFAAMEGLLAAAGHGMEGRALSELDRLWERVKAGEASPDGRPS